MTQETSIYDSEIWHEMMSGKPYDALNPILVNELNRVKDMLHAYNYEIRPGNLTRLSQLAKEILGHTGENIKIIPPFRCDYGHNITVGENFFANFNFTVLDEGAVKIGKNAFIGPNVSIFTACHPTDPIERNKGIEWSEPVTIGDNVWIGGDATILPGVSIGNNVTIGAGSVVTKNIPSNCIAVGNPARIVKTLNINEK